MRPEEAAAYLDGLEAFGMRLRLDVIEALLAAVGNPHEGLRTVHVGGTNGKGSVSALVAAALTRAGHRTGLYVSPHLTRFEERITIDGARIPPADLAEGVAALAPAIEEVSKRLAPVTYFEAGTALAFRHFARRRVDVAVVEVGLGGRLDATNVIEDPLVSVITNIDLEHTQVLGDSVRKIAREKAGIVKPGCPLVTGAAGDALEEILAVADERVAPTRVMWRDFRPRRVAKSYEGQTVRFEGLRRDLGETRLPLIGAHQLGNAALAAAALEEVDSQGVPVPVEAVREGFAAASWPGRLQHLPGPPPLFIDGAHNPAGMRALADFLVEENLRPVVVFGCLADKAWLEMVEILAPHVSAAVVTRPASKRALEPMEAAREFSRQGAVATVVKGPTHALGTAVGQAGEAGSVLVCGSLYLVGEVLSFLRLG